MRQLVDPLRNRKNQSNLGQMIHASGKKYIELVATERFGGPKTREDVVCIHYLCGECTKGLVIVPQWYEQL